MFFSAGRESLNINFFFAIQQSVTINYKTAVRQGVEFILSCTAQGTRRITFQWLKNGVHLDTSKATRLLNLTLIMNLVSDLHNCMRKAECCEYRHVNNSLMIFTLRCDVLRARVIIDNIIGFFFGYLQKCMDGCIWRGGHQRLVHFTAENS